ncbi:hypothetical protein AKJ09_09853 [Labilithrix luteola]|uniref:Uncharacterized protein n=1 Tax=Labilithrix luteola TaxID=1391654 RepID=A0A0K1QCN5_9BACT|nr:hypothetical protein [Labilithrix luteola]AKV03190.1 hypothetical protein AKJ09_09853 [Labilithrix luteola]
MFVKIVDDARAWFAAQGIDAPIVEEVEELVAQDNYSPTTSNRVAFVTASNLDIIAPTQVGDGDDGEGRQLSNLDYAFEVHIAGFDPDSPTRMLAHRRVCIALLEALEQSFVRSASGLYALGTGEWNDERKHGRHGAELIVPLKINVPLSDVDSATAHPAPKPGAPKPVP